MNIENSFSIVTPRLILREYLLSDFDALYEIFSDAETMQYYPAPFDAIRVKKWILWNIENYKNIGFELWAVTLKSTKQFIGDCGLTLQNIDGKQLPEIGYHIHKNFWQHGFANEAASAVRDWAFNNTNYDQLFAYMKYNNIASAATARSIGMKKLKEFPDEKNTISHVYYIAKK